MEHEIKAIRGVIERKCAERMKGMTVKIGNVIENKNGLHVITQITNGTVADTEKLEDYIARNALAQEDGEWKTINEVIKERSDMYLKSGIEIIKDY